MDSNDLEYQRLTGTEVGFNVKHLPAEDFFPDDDEQAIRAAFIKLRNDKGIDGLFWAVAKAFGHTPEEYPQEELDFILNHEPELRFQSGSWWVYFGKSPDSK